MSRTRGTKKCGTSPSSMLQGSNDVANSGESAESGIDTWGGGAGCEGGMGQITNFEDLDSHPKGAPQASRGPTQQTERLHSHSKASTSLRFGFTCVYEILDHEYQEWLLEMGYTEDFPTTSFLLQAEAHFFLPAPTYHWAGLMHSSQVGELFWSVCLSG